jgi:hypothetical protein
MYNAFNRANFYAPNQYLGNRSPDPNNAGQYVGSFGTISNAFPARDTQFGFKFLW